MILFLRSHFRRISFVHFLFFFFRGKKKVRWLNVDGKSKKKKGGKRSSRSQEYSQVCEIPFASDRLL